MEGIIPLLAVLLRSHRQTASLPLPLLLRRVLLLAREAMPLLPLALELSVTWTQGHNQVVVGISLGRGRGTSEIETLTGTETGTGTGKGKGIVTERGIVTDLEMIGIGAIRVLVAVTGLEGNETICCIP